jgi:hypothetical protein
MKFFHEFFYFFSKFFSTVILLADHEYRIYKSYFGIDLLFKVVENTGILHPKFIDNFILNDL